MLETGLDTLITFNPWTLTTSTTLADLVALLESTDTRAWLVVDGDFQLAGLISTTLIADAIEACAGDAQQRATLRSATVAELMRADIASVDQAQSAHQLLKNMLHSPTSLLPVTDAGRVIGTLSRQDFLRELSYGASAVAKDSLMDHCQLEHQTFDTDETLKEAFAELCETEPSVGVVVRGDLPVGTVSRGTVAQQLSDECVRGLFGAPAQATTLGQWLKSCPTITPGRTLGEAAQLMVEHQLDTLAIANQAGHLVAVVTEDHLLRAMLEE